MDQIAVCNKYIKEKFSHFKEELPWVFKFIENDEEKELIIVEEKEGKLFNEDFHLILSKLNNNKIQITLHFCLGGSFITLKVKI